MEISSARYEYGKVQQKRPKKRRLGLVAAALFLLISSGYGVLAYRKPVDAFVGEKQVLQTIQAADVEINWPTKGQAAIGDKDDGLLALYSDTEKQQPIASITKVITALVILDNESLALGEQGKIHTIGQADIDSYRSYVAQLGSVMPVNMGQQITTYQALQGLILPSANNIAYSLAIWNYGSIDAYLTAANQYLEKQGLTHTIVADASGFLPGSMSTPSDLIKIGQLALSHPVLAEIMNQRDAVIPGTGAIRNTNFLLQTGEQAIGIKTGTTDEAGYCLLFAVKHGPNNDRTLIGAVLGQSSWSELYSQVNVLRDQALSHYKTIEIAPAGTTVGQYKTAWGQTADAVTLDAMSVYTWSGATQNIDAYLEELEAPLQAGTVVGNAWVSKDKGVMTKVIIRQPLNPPNLFWKLTNYW